MAEAVAVATLAAVVVLTLAVAAVPVALPVAVPGPRQLSTVAAFERHRPSGVHTLAEMLADQAPHLDSIMVVIACLPRGHRGSLAQSVDPQGRMSAESLRQIVNQAALAQSQRGVVLRIRGFRPRQIVNQTG